MKVCIIPLTLGAPPDGGLPEAPGITATLYKKGGIK